MPTPRETEQQRAGPRWKIVSLAFCILSGPLPVAAAETPPRNPPARSVPRGCPVDHSTTTVDVVLTKTGKLEGIVVLASGRAAEGAAVVVRGAKRQELSAMSDASGHVSIGPLEGGVYAMAVGGRIFTVRAWRAGTAPPAARAHAVFVLGIVARCQSPVGGFFRSDRFLLAATITSAIVVPIAVYANRHDGQPGS